MSDMKNLDYVMVTTVVQNRIRYAVPASALKDENDEIDPNKAVELVKDSKVDQFSQSFMGESIVDAAALSEEGVLHMFDIDNDYLASWSNEQKLNFINNWEYVPESHSEEVMGE